jgi:hypothetical protein
MFLLMIEATEGICGGSLHMVPDNVTEFTYCCQSETGLYCWSRPEPQARIQTLFIPWLFLRGHAHIDTPQPSRSDTECSQISSRTCLLIYLRIHNKFCQASM